MSADAGEERDVMNNDLARAEDTRGSMGRDLPARGDILDRLAKLADRADEDWSNSATTLREAISILKGAESALALVACQSDADTHQSDLAECEKALDRIRAIKAVADDAGLPEARPGERSTPPLPSGRDLFREGVEAAAKVADQYKPTQLDTASFTELNRQYVKGEEYAAALIWARIRALSRK